MLRWLSGVLWLLFFISFFLIFIYTYVALANLITAPFNSLLAERVERYLTGHDSARSTLLNTFKDLPRIMVRQLWMIGYYVPRALGIFILFFIPIIQAIAAIIWFLFNSFFMTLVYIDYPNDNHRIPLKDVRLWLKQHRWVSLGFGMSVLVVSMIPILNFFAMPAAVAGATKLWVEGSKLKLD